MNDRTRGRFDADSSAGCYDHMVTGIPEVTQALSISLKKTNQDLERIENDATQATTAANEQTPASATVEALTVASEGSWIDTGSGFLFTPSAAISSSDEIVADKECIAEALQGTRDSPSCKNGVHKRRDDIGEQNEVPPTAAKGCLTTECRRGRCRKSATTPGSESQGDCHSKAAERPARIYGNRAVLPNLQSLPESLRGYLDSPLSEDPWLPKGLLQDPSIVPYSTADVVTTSCK